MAKLKSKIAEITNKEARVENIKSMMSGGVFGYNVVGNYLGTNTFINKQQLYELYRSSADLRQAIRKIAQYCGLNGILLKDPTQNEYPSDDNTKALREQIMYILSNPTFLNTKIEIVKHLIVSGELYIIPTYSPIDNMGKKVINGLHVIDPRTITKQIADGRIIGYVQSGSVGTVGISKTYTSIEEDATDQKPLLKYYTLEKHINNELYGMGLLEGILRDTMADLEASKRNYYFFENDMGRSQMIMLDKDLSEPEQNILLQQLKEQYSRPKNAHKPILGVGINDVKQLSLSPKDMEHVKQRQFSTEKICGCLGVPKNILGYVDNVNYANGQEMKKEFIDGTIRPWEKFMEYIINDIVQCYTDDFELYIELDGQVEEDSYKEKEAHLKEVNSGVITINEYRAHFDREPFEEPYANKPIVNKNQVLLEDITLDVSATNLPT